MLISAGAKLRLQILDVIDVPISNFEARIILFANPIGQIRLTGTLAAFDHDNIVEVICDVLPHVLRELVYRVLVEIPDEDPTLLVPDHFRVLDGQLADRRESDRSDIICNNYHSSPPPMFHAPN